ncbi:MAG: bifunctional oligoribonuclease/PAP phosphatase NrnA [Syntrophales bacterium]|jgi:phosphoesterase RecJ-like protein
MLHRIIEVIERCGKFLVTGHERLDGDAIGSELALYHLLVGMEKDAVVYNDDTIPGNYRFLPGSEYVVQELDDMSVYEAVFVLDCSELKRVGKMAERIGRIPEIVNIDHHMSNGGFSQLTMIDSAASSTGELLYRLIKTMGRAITKDMATNLYTAILTDTGGFRYGSTNAASLMAAADLVEKGASPQWISEHVYESDPPAKIHLLTRVLGTLSLDCEGKVGSVMVTLRDFELTGTMPEHTENFVDVPRTIEGVIVSILYQEIEDRFFKVSLRSKGTFNIERVARAFGGGGHLNAAACRIRGDIESVKQRILNEITAG